MYIYVYISFKCCIIAESYFLSGIFMGFVVLFTIKNPQIEVSDDTEVMYQTLFKMFLKIFSLPYQLDGF